MKFTRTIKFGLLTALVCSSLGLTGCGGSEAKQSSAQEIEAFNGNSDSPEAKAAVEKAKAESAASAAKAQAAAQQAPPPK